MRVEGKLLFVRNEIRSSPSCTATESLGVEAQSWEITRNSGRELAYCVVGR